MAEEEEEEEEEEEVVYMVVSFVMKWIAVLLGYPATG